MPSCNQLKAPNSIHRRNRSILKNGGCERAVVLRGLVAGLPWAVHLVAQTPHPDAERLLDAVGAALVRQLGASGNVGVFKQVERLFESARRG